MVRLVAYIGCEEDQIVIILRGDVRTYPMKLELSEVKEDDRNKLIRPSVKLIHKKPLVSHLSKSPSHDTVRLKGKN